MSEDEFIVHGRHNEIAGSIPSAAWTVMQQEGEGESAIVALVGLPSPVQTTHQLLAQSSRGVVVPLAWVEFIPKSADGTAYDDGRLRIYVLLLGEWLNFRAASEVVKGISLAPYDGPEEWVTRICRIPPVCFYPPDYELPKKRLEALAEMFLLECRRAAT